MRHKNMNKREIKNYLRRKVHNSAGLPGNIDIDLQDGKLLMVVKKPYVNMQLDNAAFEGWIVSLKYWLNRNGILIDKVTLAWVPDKVPVNKKDLQHINRFLFRVMMFKKMNYKWFEIDERNKDELTFCVWQVGIT